MTNYETYSRRALNKELENAIARVEETQSDYYEACQDVWDVLYHRIPHPQEVLKIGKRGHGTRMTAQWRTVAMYEEHKSPT